MPDESSSSSLVSSIISSSSVSSVSSSSDNDDSCGTTKSLTLTMSVPDRYNENRHTGYRITVTVDSSCNFDEYIFRMFKHPNQSGDFFSGICSWYEMVTLPIDAPLPNACPQHFRAKSIDVVLPNPVLVNSFWQEIKKEITTLLASAEINETLVESQTVTLVAS